MLFLGNPCASAYRVKQKNTTIRFQSGPSTVTLPFFILFKNSVLGHTYYSHRNYLLMEITDINQTKYVWQARPQTAMILLYSRAHSIVYMNWTKIVSVSHNSTKFTLIRIIGAGSLFDFHGIPYLCEVKNVLSALLNQGHNQQSAKNMFTLYNYLVSTITMKLTTVNTLHRQ